MQNIDHFNLQKNNYPSLQNCLYEIDTHYRQCLLQNSDLSEITQIAITTIKKIKTILSSEEEIHCNSEITNFIQLKQEMKKNEKEKIIFQEKTAKKIVKLKILLGENKQSLQSSNNELKTYEIKELITELKDAIFAKEKAIVSQLKEVEEVNKLANKALKKILLRKAERDHLKNRLLGLKKCYTAQVLQQKEIISNAEALLHSINENAKKKCPPLQTKQLKQMTRALLMDEYKRSLKQLSHTLHSLEQLQITLAKEKLFDGLFLEEKKNEEIGQLLTSFEQQLPNHFIEAKKQLQTIKKVEQVAKKTMTPNGSKNSSSAPVVKNRKNFLFYPTKPQYEQLLKEAAANKSTQPPFLTLEEIKTVPVSAYDATTDIYLKELNLEKEGEMMDVERFFALAPSLNQRFINKKAANRNAMSIFTKQLWLAIYKTEAGEVFIRYTPESRRTNKTTFYPGQILIYGWRGENRSDRQWPRGSCCKQLEGVKMQSCSKMQVLEKNLLGRSKQNEPIDFAWLAFKITAPQKPGIHHSCWTLCDGREKDFGKPLKISIEVEAKGTDECTFDRSN